MGLLSSIWNLIMKILGAIFSWIGDLLGDWFLIILIIVLIWFAPVIAVWLTSVGAPSFLVSVFTSMSSLTPYVIKAGTWLWGGASSLVSTAWSSYKGLETGTQAAIALGAAALIAPEETATLITDAADLVSTGAESILGAVVGAATSSPILLAVGGLAIWYFFFRDKSQKVVIDQPSNSNTEKLGAANA